MVLAGLLLGVILGFIPAPMFSGDKPIESATLDSVARLEGTVAAIIMRLDQNLAHADQILEALDRLTCVNLMAPEDRKTALRLARSREELHSICLWLQMGAGGHGGEGELP